MSHPYYHTIINLSSVCVVRVRVGTPIGKALVEQIDASYYNWSLLRTRAGGLGRFSVLQLLCRLSADLNEIGHGQSFGVRQQRRGVGILKFGRVAMEIGKCGLWASVWDWRSQILRRNLLKILIIWTHKFFGNFRIWHFLPVSMETVKSRFWGADI